MQVVLDAEDDTDDELDSVGVVEELELVEDSELEDEELELEEDELDEALEVEPPGACVEVLVVVLPGEGGARARK